MKIIVRCSCGQELAIEDQYGDVDGWEVEVKRCQACYEAALDEISEYKEEIEALIGDRDSLLAEIEELRVGE
jgi:hypothetical protein